MRGEYVKVQYPEYTGYHLIFTENDIVLDSGHFRVMLFAVCCDAVHSITETVVTTPWKDSLCVLCPVRAAEPVSIRLSFRPLRRT